jgi:hypothetical protein
MGMGAVAFAHPAFAPYRDWLRDGTLPEVATLNAWARERALALPDGPELSFVEGAVAGALAYETTILRDGRIHVRRGSWHDAFNALAWLAFPRTKAALNACHVAEGAGGGANARTRARDAATLLDESGMIVVCADASLERLLREHAWHALFVARRDDVVAMLYPWVLGHGLLHKLRSPYRALTANVLWIPRAGDDGVADGGRVDAAAAASLDARAPDPAFLLRLPVAALPGWDTEALGARLFDDTAVFRPSRATLIPS